MDVPGPTRTDARARRARMPRMIQTTAATRTMLAKRRPVIAPLARSGRKTAGSEEHLLVGDDELLVQHQLERLREHLSLERLAALLYFLERVLADADVEDVLQDHRALVELLGHEVRRAAGDPHAFLER